MPIDENFYKAFEDKFIGEEEVHNLSLSDVLWDESVKIMRDNINEVVKDAG